MVQVFSTRSRRLSVLVGLIAAASLGMTFWARETFNECKWHSYERLSNPDINRTALFPLQYRRILAEFVPQLFWASCLVWSVWSRRLTTALLQLLYFASWLPGLTVVEYLKVATSDMACHYAHANGVSGHYYYFGWGMSSLFLLEHSLPPWLVLPGYVLFASVFAFQGWFTVYYGYHSLRQCALGAVAGIAWAALSFELIALCGASFFADVKWHNSTPDAAVGGSAKAGKKGKKKRGVSKV
jgi:hypothetical protein